MASEAVFDLAKSRRSLREDFAKLGRVVATERRHSAGEATIASGRISLIEKIVEHSTQHDLIAVFDADIDDFQVGRVILFEDFFRSNTGIDLRHVKVMAHCIKVFFELSSGWRERKEAIKDVFASDVFEGVREGTGLSYVQFAGQLFPPQRTKP